MKVIVELRQGMLNVIKDSIEHVSISDKTITFRNESGDPLAIMEFQDLIDTGDAQYMFRAIDDTNILKAIVTADGRVVDFIISGYDGSGVDTSALSGSVGKLTSTADIRFNKLDWSEGASITITDLRIYVKQGT